MVSIPFGNMFGQSPIKPIQRHMIKAQACAAQLEHFIAAVLVSDWEQAAKQQNQISILENEADDMKRSIRLHLPKNLFLPVPRSDLLELVTMQDKIANNAKDIAGLMLGREMEIPQAIKAAMESYVKKAIATSAQAVKAIDELDKLLDTGFSGRELETVEALISELDRLETETDELEVAIRASLFKVENDLPPIGVMFLYKIIELIGDLADSSQRVGARLQILIAR
ncbi:hypothetical protein EDC56_3069 [Sinobacterium caligoides]|uniref:TIGR00153 family protein n=1 Tax=Sinobacterium caligoides TaxID=933926 RepID=A0A3N2DHG9_9GAMM|nr:TIGR00153 family protein [Sinobacterium caligoides]ROR98834.1 hypothetical protein EDC56_3069 [Sinobacterium caligoides]